MRLQRLLMSCGVVAAVAAACAHEDPVSTPVSQNGEDTIEIITLSPAPAGFLSGTFSSVAPFDTSVADAFGRSSTGPASFMPEPSQACYGSAPLIYEPGKNVSTFASPTMFLPTVTPVTLRNAGCGQATGYIVPASQGANGPNVWEFWHDFVATSGVRYVSGLARYALVQRGALDPAEFMLNGSVATKDTLVFKAGDFNPGGYKADAVYTGSCAAAQHLSATGATNPLLLGGTVATGGTADIDQTVCASGTGADTFWAKAPSVAKSPIAPNNATRLDSAYNFMVIWVALPDSTPDYTKPVFRFQIGPLTDVSGNVINNAFAPIPSAVITAAQQGALPGAPPKPDSVKATFNNLRPLAAGAYQVWFLNTQSAGSGRITARVIRTQGGANKDTLNGVAEFNLIGAQDGAKVDFAFKGQPIATPSWDRIALVIQPTAGATTLASKPAEPLWGKFVSPKLSGQPGFFAGNLSFGSFDNGAADSMVYGAGGSGTGGFFGTQLVQALSRMARPPVGFEYQAWLLNSGNASVHTNAGVLRGPAPDYVSLADADTMSTSPLSGAELTQATFATNPGTYAAWCKIGTISGTPPDTSITPIYDQLQIRLSPKGADPNTLPATVVLSGPLSVPVGASHNKGKCAP